MPLSSQHVFDFVPAGGPRDFILLMGADGVIADPARFQSLGYGNVVAARDGRFDIERDFYPYPNAHFKAIVSCDLIETLKDDPMYMMEEIHRVLRPRCHLVFSTGRFEPDQVRGLLENCGLEVMRLEKHEDRVYAAARKVGAVRERYPRWLYPDRG